MNGLKIKHMAMVFTVILMGLNMKEIGKMINKMVKALNHGLMEPLMKENIKQVKNSDLANLNGQMVLLTKDNFLIII